MHIRTTNVFCFACRAYTYLRGLSHHLGVILRRRPTKKLLFGPPPHLSNSVCLDDTPHSLFTDVQIIWSVNVRNAKYLAILTSVDGELSHNLSDPDADSKHKNKLICGSVVYGRPRPPPSAVVHIGSPPPPGPPPLSNGPLWWMAPYWVQFNLSNKEKLTIIQQWQNFVRFLRLSVQIEKKRHYLF